MRLDKNRFATTAVVTGILLASGAAPLSLSESALAAPSPAVTLTGSVGTLPGEDSNPGEASNLATDRISSVILVEVEVPLGANTNSKHIPTGFSDIPVATEQTTGGTFSIPVAESSVLSRAENLGHGWVNFDIVVDSGSQFTSQYVPVALTAAAAAGNVAAARQVRSRSVTVGQLRPFHAMGSAVRESVAASGVEGNAPDSVICTWHTYGTQTESAARIGEVHVSASSGESMTFKYATQADSSFTVGLSTAGPTSGWTPDGSAEVSNTFSGSGSFPNVAGTDIYANAHFYYQRYENDGADSCPGIQYKNQTVSAVGDSFQGTNTPPAPPTLASSCWKDPYGYAKADPGGGTFDSDRGTAASYSGVATVWGLRRQHRILIQHLPGLCK